MRSLFWWRRSDNKSRRRLTRQTLIGEMALAEVMEEKDDDGSKTHTGKRASDERYESKRNIRFSKNGTPHILCSLEDSFASSISNSFYDQPKLGCYPISVDLQLGNNSSLYISEFDRIALRAVATRNLVYRYIR
jgi:hypothetical protein